MSRRTMRTAGSALIWIGAVEVVGSFMAKMMFNMATPALFNPIFFGFILIGILIIVVARGVW